MRGDTGGKVCPRIEVLRKLVTRLELRSLLQIATDQTEPELFSRKISDGGKRLHQAGRDSGLVGVPDPKGHTQHSRRHLQAVVNTSKPL